MAATQSRSGEKHVRQRGLTGSEPEWLAGHIAAPQARQRRIISSPRLAPSKNGCEAASGVGTGLPRLGVDTVALF